MNDRFNTNMIYVHTCNYVIVGMWMTRNQNLNKRKKSKSIGNKNHKSSFMISKEGNKKTFKPSSMELIHDSALIVGVWMHKYASICLLVEFENNAAVRNAASGVLATKSSILFTNAIL